VRYLCSQKEILLFLAVFFKETLFRLFRLVTLMGKIKAVETTHIKDQSKAKISGPLMTLTLAALKSFKQGRDVIHICIQETGEFIAIPKSAMELLSSMLSNDIAITIVPRETELTTQKAANMLNVSRPHIVKLLEEGAIPFKKVGSHRRVLLKDIVHYRSKLDQQRAKSLARLAEEAQALGLGY
jgi:excisionase family DNA binding protein